jgi:hypothetical protein
MNDIKTIFSGFKLNEFIYSFNGSVEVISDSQCHVPTDQGIILLDLSCTINQITYIDINLFVQSLYQELQILNNN